MVTYRVGFPGWKLVARLGLPLEVRFSLSADKESDYLSAFSDDFSPCVILAAEGATLEELVKEVKAEIQEAMEIIFHRLPKRSISVTFIPNAVLS